MNTLPLRTAALSDLPSEVSAIVGKAREGGPILLVDHAERPCGVVLGFDDLEEAEDWLTLNSPEGKASIARGIADKAAGRVASLADVERAILGTNGSDEIGRRLS